MPVVERPMRGLRDIRCGVNVRYPAPPPLVRTSPGGSLAFLSSTFLIYTTQCFHPQFPRSRGPASGSLRHVQQITASLRCSRWRTSRRPIRNRTW